MAVFRIEKNDGYTVMSNHHLRNNDLSLKAKGLLSQMLSLPENWDYTLSGLSVINRESKDAIRSAINELEQAGYIRRHQTVDARGKFSVNEYIIYEQPQHRPSGSGPDEAAGGMSGQPSLDYPLSENPTTGNPTTENPMPEKPLTGKPLTENPTQINKDILNTDLQSKDGSITDAFSSSSLPVRTEPPEGKRGKGSTQTAVDARRRDIMVNIGYDRLISDSPADKGRIDEIVDLVLETMCTARKTIRISGDDYPAELVRERFSKLNGEHIRFALDCMRENTTQIRNMRQYIRAVLFNAPSTWHNSLSARDTSRDKPVRDDAERLRRRLDSQCQRDDDIKLLKKLLAEQKPSALR